MKKIWVTDSGIVHHRKPEMEATEYVEVTDQGLLERTAMRLAYENDKLRSQKTGDFLTRGQDDVPAALKRLEQHRDDYTIQEYDVIKLALAQQQPDAPRYDPRLGLIQKEPVNQELLVALKDASAELNRRNRYDVQYETTRVLANVSFVIKRVEQNGGENE